MRYLKNIKSFFSKRKKSIEEILYKQISHTESSAYKQEHTRENFSLQEINEFKRRKFSRLIFYNRKKIDGVVSDTFCFDDGTNCNKISTTNFEVSKFSDDWYIFEMFDEFDYVEQFLCDTWDGVTQILNRFNK